MSYKFLGSPNQTYNTRGASYVADAYGVVTIPGPSNQDIADLVNAGLISLGVAQARSSLTSTIDPVVTNDSTQDYGIGSRWLNLTTGVEWICMSGTAGAAVWVPNVSSGMLLGRILNANMNSTADQPFLLTNYAALNTFRITKITAKNASTSLTTAAGGVYPLAAKGGTAIVAASQAYSALTTSALALDLTLVAPNAVYAKGVAPILSLTTPQGAAAIADLYLFGDVYN